MHEGRMMPADPNTAVTPLVVNMRRSHSRQGGVMQEQLGLLPIASISPLRVPVISLTTPTTTVTKPTSTAPSVVTEIAPMQKYEMSAEAPTQKIEIAVPIGTRAPTPESRFASSASEPVTRPRIAMSKRTMLIAGGAAGVGVAALTYLLLRKSR